jgi:PKD repeat protein
LTIVRIQEIDEIDGLGGDWDWYYWIGDSESGSWSWTMYEAPDGQDVTVNQQHTFSVTDQSLSFGIFLCEDDFWTADDYADISSGSMGGGDDVNCDPNLVTFPAGAYSGVWTFQTSSLSGHTVVSDPQGWRTSGDFDGSTGVDENDANLWFTISDNYSPPNANAGADKEGYIGDSISFDGMGSTASPGSSIEEYAWDFNNDGIYDQTGSIVSTTFTTKGIHTVVLRVTDSIGVQDTDTTTVTIWNLDPVASFTFAPPSPTTQDSVDFIDTSTDPDGNIVSWFWDFGDGTTSDAWNPSHQYADNGIYSVSLTVTDNDGATDTDTQTVTVTNVAPVAGFSFAPPSPSTADSVQFTDTSVDLDGTVASWAWDFGDGTLSTLQSPSHQYDDDGTYGVSLTVTDDDGATDTVSMDVVVTNEPPTADFTCQPTQAFINEQIDFTDQSTDSDGTISQWLWDFGDGATSIDQNPTHSYTDPGTYTVTLTVTDDDGDTDVSTDSVTILAQGGGNIPPSAGFSYTPQDPYAGQDVDFTDESSDADGSIASWSWDFGDGTSSTEENPTHRYSSPGTYTVTLTVTDDEGETDSDTASITVDPPPQGVDVDPISLFSCNPENPNVGESVQMTDSSTDPDGTIEEWEWDFGDGTSSTARNPSHSYTQSGEYTVSLTVTDDDGLTDTSTMTIVVTGEDEGGIDFVALLPWIILMLIIVIGLIVVFAFVRRRKPE